MFNYDATEKLVNQIKVQILAIEDGLAKRRAAEQKIANGHVNGQSLAEEDKLVAMLKTLTNETYGDANGLVALADQLHKLAYMSKEVARVTSTEAVVCAAVTKPRKIKLQ